MAENAQAAAAAPAQANTSGMRGEIAQKWSKFTPQDVAALKSKDDLVSGVQTNIRSTRPRPRKTSTPLPTAGSSKRSVGLFQRRPSMQIAGRRWS